MISIVMAARNDSYGGDFMRRLQTSLYVLSSIISATNNPAAFEVIIVEWNPPADTPSLRDAIGWWFGGCSLRIITVPAEVHRGYAINSPTYTLFEYTAKNVGIRRAQGDFVLSTNADIIFSPEMIQRISGSLDPTRFYRAERSDVFRDTLLIGSAYDILTRCERSIQQTHKWDGVNPFFEAAGDFMLLSAAGWNKMGGYPELGWNHHIDSYGVLDAQRAGLTQVVLTERLYHQEHTRAERDERAKGIQFDSMITWPRLPNWGAHDRDLPTWELKR